jgi:predicted nucleic acid-binding protein
MKTAFDSSVLVATIVVSEAFHEECCQCVDTGGGSIYQHGLVEVFNTLTGGRRDQRLSARDAAKIVSSEIARDLSVATLSVKETLQAMAEAESRGVRGGAIYDFLHLKAACKFGANRVVTLNSSHFEAFWRAGDPMVSHPAEL